MTMEIKTRTIALPEDAVTEGLRKKLNKNIQPEEFLPSLRVVLEHTTNGVRTILWLSLYMTSKCVSAFGGVQNIVPGFPGDEVLTEHGMRLQMDRLDLLKGQLEQGGKLDAEEMATIRSALKQLRARKNSNE